MSLLVAENVVKQFSNHKALDKVSMSVPPQSIYGLLGPNGAGKTTLLRIINQITAPDSGSVMLNGKPISRDDLVSIGYLPEERGLYKKMKVGEQAIYLAQLKGMTRSDAIKKLKHWFTKFEIIEWWDKKIAELSKGMQQKIQFVTTVLHEPKLLIFDEPFSGFDPINANLLKNEILKLRNDGATIIFSTHNMGSVEELCDHITLIDNANTILEGSVETIRKEWAANEYKIEFDSETEIPRDDMFNVLEQKKVNSHFEVTIKSKEGIRENDIIKKLVGLGNINSFNPALPSMNEIFIRVVEKNNPKEKS